MKHGLLLIVIWLSTSGGIADEPKSYDVEEQGRDLKITNLNNSKSLIFRNFKRYENLTIRLPFKDDELDPESKKKLMRLIEDAKVFFSSGKYAKAWESLTKAEAVDSKNPDVKTMKGSLQLQFGNKEEARKYYIESLRLNPNQPGVRKMLDSLKSR